jgi:hypothetical protein
MSKTFKVFLDEAASKSLSRVLRHTEGRNIGMITAHRGEYNPKENAARNSELEGDLRSAGHGFIKVKGRYVENHGTKAAKAVDENSYLVTGKKGDDKGALLHTLKNLGSKFEQDSILHKGHDEPTAKLHGTKEGGWPGAGETHDVGVFHPNRAGEFHTAMKGSRTFAFESVEAFSFVNPVTFSSRVETLF